MDDKHYYTYLYDKFLRGACTKSELASLFEHFKSEEVAPELLEAITRELASMDDINQQTNDRVENIVNKSDQAIREQVILPHLLIKKRKQRVWLQVAAAVVVLCVIGALYTFWTESAVWDSPMQALVEDDIMPGTNQATITLADGRTYELSDNGGVIVDKTGIHYENGETIVPTSEVPSATIVTPRGGQYRLVLPDSTTVWLNADSRLTYPMAFVGGERVVQLEGEAYFDVTKKGKQPFVVQVDQMRVQVLGTEFNIRGYQNEPTYTTLVTGSVDVHIDNTAESIRLRPADQIAVLDNKYTVTEVNTLSYTGWKEGIFYFHNLTLAEVFSQIERWYDVATPSGDSVPDITVYGEIDRHTPLREVLNLLELATSVPLDLDERRVTIQ